MRITYINIKGNIYHFLNDELGISKLLGDNDAVPYNLRDCFLSLMDMIRNKESCKNTVITITGLGSFIIICD